MVKTKKVKRVGDFIETKEERPEPIPEKQFETLEEQNKQMKVLLIRLPFQIFLLTADADDVIDIKEITSFRRYLAARKEKCLSPYTRRIFQNTVIHYKVLEQLYKDKKLVKSIEEFEEAVRYIQKCVSKKEMTEISQDLIGLSVAIAEASGGFMGIVNTISDEERDMISKMEAICLKAVEGIDGGSHPPQQ